MSMNEVGLTPTTKKLLDKRQFKPTDRAFGYVEYVDKRAEFLANLARQDDE